MISTALRTALKKLFPDDRLSTDAAALKEAGRDLTEAEPVEAELIVYPTSVEEVQALVNLASKHKTPLVPMMGRTNVGGLTLPTHGGISVDFSRMNRIIEVNAEDMYAVVEPGVTFGQMKEYLDAHHPNVRYGYPLAPPETSVALNCLMDGLANLSYKNGQMSQWITGLEAVLANGEVFHAGPPAAGAPWFGRCPLPDLIGLFVNFFGSTGLVTKLGVELWPLHPLRYRAFVLAGSAETAFSLLRNWSRLELADDLGSLSWPTGKMLFGETIPHYRHPTEPEFFLYYDLSAETKAEMKAKRLALEGVITKLRREGHAVESPMDLQDLVKLEPSFSQFADFPTRLTFLLDHPGGGLSWVGAYGPMSRLDEGYRKGERILAQHGFPPTVVVRPMRRGHFAVERFITLFDREDPAQRQRVRACNEALIDMVLDLGFLPYKTPDWVVERLKPRMNPAYLTLLGQMKRLMDPERILNPGRWEVGNGK